MAKKKKSENVFAFKDNSIWVGATISLHLEKDTCHWQSMCYETSPRFNISLREIFFKSGSIKVIKNIKKVLSCRFYKDLGHFKMLTIKGCSETVFFRE